jgi:hypothetical protein
MPVYFDTQLLLYVTIHLPTYQTREFVFCPPTAEDLPVVSQLSDFIVLWILPGLRLAPQVLNNKLHFCVASASQAQRA